MNAGPARPAPRVPAGSSSLAVAASRRDLLSATAALPAVGVADSASSIDSDAFSTALREYYGLRDADEFDCAHGAMRQANDRFYAATDPLRAMYYRYDMAPAEVRPEWDAHMETMKSAEDVHCEQYARPRGRAFDRLLATPSRSIDDVLLKISLADDEGESDILSHVTSDLRRLTGTL